LCSKTPKTPPIPHLYVGTKHEYAFALNLILLLYVERCLW
jgi:hypothetical protein